MIVNNFIREPFPINLSTLETISSKHIEIFTEKKMKRISISIVFLACLVASTAAQSESGVIAYWTDYNVTDNNWDLNASNVSCATVDGDKDLEWRSKYGWTGYCGSAGPQGEEACGKCLSVRNIILLLISIECKVN